MTIDDIKKELEDPLKIEEIRNSPDTFDAFLDKMETLATDDKSKEDISKYLKDYVQKNGLDPSLNSKIEAKFAVKQQDPMLSELQQVKDELKQVKSMLAIIGKEKLEKEIAKLQRKQVRAERLQKFGDFSRNAIRKLKDFALRKYHEFGEKLDNKTEAALENQDKTRSEYASALFGERNQLNRRDEMGMRTPIKANDSWKRLREARHQAIKADKKVKLTFTAQIIYNAPKELLRRYLERKRQMNAPQVAPAGPTI